MEDLIPLFIVIAISIIAAVGKKKKRLGNEDISSPFNQNRKDSDILNWLEKLGLEEEVTPLAEEKPFSANERTAIVKDTPEVVKTPEKEVAINAFSQYSGFISPEEKEQIMAKEGVSSIGHKKTENDLTQQPVIDPEKEDEKPKIAFDLKQAVIFSELLNRKYV